MPYLAPRAVVTTIVKLAHHFPILRRFPETRSSSDLRYDLLDDLIEALCRHETAIIDMRLIDLADETAREAHLATWPTAAHDPLFCPSCGMYGAYDRLRCLTCGYIDSDAAPADHAVAFAEIASHEVTLIRTWEIRAQATPS